jgi:hypothetical protein
MPRPSPRTNRTCRVPHPVPRRRRSSTTFTASPSTRRLPWSAPFLPFPLRLSGRKSGILRNLHHRFIRYGSAAGALFFHLQRLAQKRNANEGPDMTPPKRAGAARSALRYAAYAGHSKAPPAPSTISMRRRPGQPRVDRRGAAADAPCAQGGALCAQSGAHRRGQALRVFCGQRTPALGLVTYAARRPCGRSPRPARRWTPRTTRAGLRCTRPRSSGGARPSTRQGECSSGFPVCTGCVGDVM